MWVSLSHAPGTSPSPNPASKGQEVGRRGLGRLTHRPNGELLLDQLLQFTLAQGVLVALLTGVLVEDGHQEANSLIQGARHG